MLYIYTAVFTQVHPDGKVYARVPDLHGCVTTGKNLKDAISQITDAASNWLVVAEDENLPIAKPTPQNELIHDSGDVVTLIQIDTIDYRARTDTKAVRKNVSLPAWMANLAERRGINCSQLLQESLRARLSAQ